MSQLSASSWNVPLTWSGVTAGSGLSINAGKTIIAPFTRRTKFKLDLLVLGHPVIDYVKEVKEDYLGIILHQKLTVLGLHR